jgi:dTDP-4-amino-4,6-dideoxy-D-galactose acyltransferase
MTAGLARQRRLIAPAPCDILDWDTSFWGVPIARIRGDTLTTGRAAMIDRWAIGHGVRCLYFLARIEDAETLRVAEASKFDIVDLRTTLTFVSADRPPQFDHQPPNSTVAIREHHPLDIPALRAITGDCYHDSRFYRDPHFERARCRALYETWITRSCEGYADLVLVAEVGGVVSGFISCHLTRESSSGTIGLVGVSPQARNLRVGQALVCDALSWLTAQGAREVSVVTQGRNVAAQRLYQRCGFHYSAEQIWFHKWYPLS